MNFTQDLLKYPFMTNVSKLAGEKNIQVFIVGGFVRDLILNRSRNEIDFLVIGDGAEFASALAKLFGINKVTIFKNFGTAHFKFQDYDLEFVGSRKESYTIL
jgi:tRNA nucleotidyltransferase/poly(A) polymerase